MNIEKLIAMRLVKKIKFKRAKELKQFKKIEEEFKHIKTIGSINDSLHSVDDLSKLHFYFILDYVNLISEKIDYDKIFPKNTVGKNVLIDYNILMDEQEKLKKYIAEKQKRGPEFFKKLGILNEVVNCWLIVTTKSNTRSIHKVDLNKKGHVISIKLNHKNLPEEFEQLCVEFAKSRQHNLDKEHQDFKDFMEMNSEEQDNMIQDMLHNVQYPPIIFMEDINEDGSCEPLVNNVQNSGLTIINAAESSINKITDIEILSVMLESALEEENYELCAKIRDRIQDLKSKS